MPEDRRRRRRRRLAAVAVIVSLFGALLLAEAIVRILAPPWLQFRMDFLAKGGEPDDAGTDRAWKVVLRNGEFVSFEPNSSFDVTHAEYSHRATIDALGGRTVTPIRAGPIVPCLGDSFTFGVGVHDEETFVSLLQRRCAGYRLANLGVPGTALPSQRRFLETRLEELGAPKKAVVFFFMGNDFEDLRHAAVRVSEPVAVSRGLLWHLNDFVSTTPLRRSYLLQAIKHGLLRVMKGQPRNPVFYVMDPSNGSYLQETKAALAAELAHWVRLRTTRRIEVLFVLVPDAHQLDANRRDKQAGFYGLDGATLDPRLPNKIVAGELERAGFSLVDVSELIGRDCEGLYYVNDGHFTAAGHSAFARLIGPAVESWLRAQ